jgi:hypothetical protein
MIATARHSILAMTQIAGGISVLEKSVPLYSSG